MEGSHTMKQPPKKATGFFFGHAGRIVLAYVIFGAVWILFSDMIVSSLTSSEETLSRIQSYKGLFFIVMTALVLFLLIRQAERSLKRENRARQEIDKHSYTA